MLEEPDYQEYKDLELGAAYNQPYCQWLLGCWDAVLLPKCAQWIKQVTVIVDMLHGLHQPYQTACLMYALTCVPSVTQLSLQWEREWATTGLRFHPAPLSVSELTTVLPQLVSLHISALPLFPDMLRSLMESSPLQELRLQDASVYDSSSLKIHEDGLYFRYPCRRLAAAAWLSEQAVDDRKAKRANCRLRLALCEFVGDAMLFGCSYGCLRSLAHMCGTRSGRRTRYRRS